LPGLGFPIGWIYFYLGSDTWEFVDDFFDIIDGVMKSG
jgi:hypothetical protein